MAKTDFRLLLSGATPPLTVFRYERRGENVCFLGTQKSVSREKLWACGRLAPGEVPPASAGRKKAPSLGLSLHPPRCLQGASSCSGHSHLMTETFDWAKFPTGILDSP